MVVPARVSLITLGVVDLNRSTDFYRALGWPLSSASVFGAVSFFRTGGAVLALWGRGDLAADANVDAAATGGFRAVALAINLDTPRRCRRRPSASRGRRRPPGPISPHRRLGRLLRLLRRSRWAPLGSRLQPLLADRPRRAAHPALIQKVSGSTSQKSTHLGQKHPVVAP